MSRAGELYQSEYDDFDATASGGAGGAGVIKNTNPVPGGNMMNLVVNKGPRHPSDRSGGLESHTR